VLQKVRLAISTCLAEVGAAVAEIEKITAAVNKVLAHDVTEEQQSDLAAGIAKCRDSVATARQSLRPIDEKLGDILKAKLEAKIAAEVPELKKTELRLALLERRVERCNNILLRVKKEQTMMRSMEVGKIKEVVVRLLRAQKSAKHLSTEEFWKEFDPIDAEVVTQDRFVAFFQEIGGEAAEHSATDLGDVFAGLCKEGAKTFTKEAFLQLVELRMQVVKATVLTQEAKLPGGDLIRNLKRDEVLEVLEGPCPDGSAAAVNRVRVKAAKDGKIGWATVAGNKGTVFLKEIGN